MINSNVIYLDNNIHFKSKRSSVALINKKLYSKQRILIIEPDKTFRNIHSFFLNKIGIAEIDFANSDTKAISLANTNAYSAVFLEVFHPAYNGFDICKSLRKTLKNKNVPIIAATTYLKEYIYDSCESYGINQIITKPFFFHEYRKALSFCIPKIK